MRPTAVLASALVRPAVVLTTEGAEGGEGGEGGGGEGGGEGGGGEGGGKGGGEGEVTFACRHVVAAARKLSARGSVQPTMSIG